MQGPDSNACYKCGEGGHFQRDCKYDADKPTDSQQAQGGQSPFDSYDPVVGKWMTNLVATTPITAKAMKNLYAELNRQKDLKQTYRKKYKDLQAVVNYYRPPITLQQPVVVTSSTVKANPQVLKVALEDKAKDLLEKEKVPQPPNEGTAKKVLLKPSTFKAVTSTGPSKNPKDKTKDKPKISVAMILDLAEELQAIEQESLNDSHDSEVTQESDLKQRGQ